MTSTRTGARTGLLLLTLTLATLGACSPGDDEGVASVAGAAGSADAKAAGADEIGDFVDCLVDGGVPAVVGEGGALAFADGADVMITGDGDTLGVEVDGEDISEILAGCQEQYPDVDPFQLPTELSPEEMAQQNEAGTAWAACARESGFADIPDPRDGTVTLPEALTTERAGALGAACPPAEFGPFGLAADGMPEEQLAQVFEALFGGGAAGVVGEQG